MLPGCAAARDMDTVVGRVPVSVQRAKVKNEDQSHVSGPQSIATIYALSSASGRAGVAVIRVSGPAAGLAVDLIAPPRAKPRVAAFRKLRHPTTGGLVDEALVLFFAAPRTETGEDMTEFHVHGGRAVVSAMLAALASVPGCRMAEPGEFARRSFENGKIDLTAAEGLADLVDAETDGQRRQALRQAGGALARLYDGWRRQILSALAQVEASLDFSDEADVSRDAFDAAGRTVMDLSGDLQRHLADGRRGEILRDGFQVVLAGPPNAGKSSLLNALARRDAAIVSPEAGTTRDVVEVRLDLGGLPVIVADTAGLHNATGAIEVEGIRRTRSRAAAADLVVWVIDGDPEARASAEPDPPDGLVPDGCEVLRVSTKADLATVQRDAGAAEDVLSISVVTGTGVQALASSLAACAQARIGEIEDTALTQARHRLHLDVCREALDAFLAGPSDQPELRAEDLRRAATALGRLTGRVDIEDVLDQIFGRFCIGK